MEHEFNPDEAEPWPRKEAPTEAAPPLPPPGPPPTEPGGQGRVLAVAVGVLLLAGAGTLAMLGAGQSTPAASAAPTTTATAPPPVVVPPPSAVEAEGALPPNAPRWTVNTETWLGRTRGAAFEVSAAAPIDVWMRSVRPSLVVRCTARRIEVFVFTDSAAALEPETDDHTVSYTFDRDPMTTLRWPDGAEHNALFAPDPRELANRLLAAETFTFRFTPHNTPPVTVRFNTSGLGELLQPAATHCGR